MATCKLLLEENRNVFKGGKMNLSVRVTENGRSKYLVLAKMTMEQYGEIFVKNSMDADAVKFREQCYVKLAKAEMIVSGMSVVDVNEVERRFKGKDLPNIQKGSLKLTDMCEMYIAENAHLAYKTKGLYRYAGRCLSRGNPEILITDITAEFLRRMERKRSEKMSLQSYGSVVRHIRSVINYFKNSGRLPLGYKYPFGRGGYQIPSYTPMKQVMANDEIKNLLSAELTVKQRHALDIWELLYRCNGINFADLLRMRWSDR